MTTKIIGLKSTTQKKTIHLLLILIFITPILNTQANSKEIKFQIQKITEIIPKQNLDNNSIYLKDFMKSKDHVHPPSQTLVEDTKSNYFEESKNIQIKIKENFALPKVSDSFVETLDFSLESVKKDNEVLKLNHNFRYNITYPNNLINPHKKSLPVNQKENDSDKNLDILIHLKQPEVELNFLNRYTIQDMTHIVTVNNLILGIDKFYEKVKIFSYNIKGKIQSHNVSDFIKDNKEEELVNIADMKVTRMLLDSNGDNNRKYLMMVDNEMTVYVFKINQMTPSKEHPRRLRFDLVSKYIDERLKEREIVDFVEKNGALYVGYDFGIGIRDYKDEKQYYHMVVSLINVTNHDLLIQDFQLVDEALYIIIKDYGMKILQIGDLNFLKWIDFDFYHPYLIRFDVHENPYFNYPFLGVLVSNRQLSQGKEFFIEFSLKDRLKPLLYRSYLNDKYFLLNSLISDDKFTYIYEDNSNSLIILSRSTTATGDNSIYKFQIPEFANSELTAPLISFADDSYVFRYIGMISDSTFSFLEPVHMKNAEMTLDIKTPGQYEINLATMSDFCNLPKDKVYKCKMHLSYTINASESYGFFTIYMTIMLIALVVVIMIVIILCALVIFNFDKIKEWLKRREYIKSSLGEEIEGARELEAAREPNFNPDKSTSTASI